MGILVTSSVTMSFQSFFMFEGYFSHFFGLEGILDILWVLRMMGN